MRNVAPDQLAKSYDGQRIRVTRNDGSQVVLADARVTPTGVFGQWERASVAIPTVEIQQLAVRREDSGRTIALIGSLVGMAGTAGALVIGGGDQVSNHR
jgi:hypothetical protein